MGRPKAWLDLGGKPVLRHLAELLRPLADEIVVVAAVGQDLPPIDARVVHDRRPDLGPLPALALGLETIHSSHALVLACDTPLVRPTVLGWLDQECRRRDASAVIPVWNNIAQPLVAVYHRRVADTLTALVADGERRMQSLRTLEGVHLASTEALTALDPDGDSFRSMNTPEEYTAIRNRWPDAP
jgi:molybdopterin-guanine dinucleotide biosynthesis protein A